MSICRSSVSGAAGSARSRRHQTEVRRIRGREIELENGEHLEKNMLLWGTGYRMNLDYLGLPEYRGVDTLERLRPKLGSLIRAIDYPHLFFLGMSLIDSTSATPFFAAIEAKSTVAHIRGQCEIPKKNIPHHIVHWELFRLFAGFDHANYPRLWWRLKYFLLVWWYEVFRDKSVHISLMATSTPHGLSSFPIRSGSLIPWVH